MSKIENVLYTARTTTTGGREGTSKSDDGRLDLKLSVPKGLGGNDGPGTNPEQLFAAGYSACFIGALGVIARNADVKLPADLVVNAEVSIGPVTGSFGISAKLNVKAPSLDQNVLMGLVEKAHEICPYSNATRGNIEVDLSVG